jgi:curved DNA-binding protein CbpA
MSHLPDFYGVLGVGRGADPEAIKRAFRVKALEAHPDRGGDSEQMKLLNRAYAVLGNPLERRDFDEAWEQLQQGETPE